MFPENQNTKDSKPRTFRVLRFLGVGLGLGFASQDHILPKFRVQGWECSSGLTRRVFVLACL